jgi:hypothetical protein
MKFCFECGHTTRGEPLFCNFCGHSYEMKFCPKLHANPRFAEACSHCGSRDLSVPQPRVPFAFLLVVVLVQGFTGSLLALVSIRFAILLTAAVRSHSENYETLIVIIVLAVCWFLWTHFPTLLRRAIRRAMMTRKDSNISM